MHLVFERTKGGFKSNCNILALAWMPYYDEAKFRQALFDYHQRQLINLTSSIAANGSFALESRQNGAPRNPSDQQNSNESANGNGPNGGLPASSSSDNSHQSGQHFLNSRISELHQRYICLQDRIVGCNMNSSCFNGIPNDDNENNDRRGIMGVLDTGYGRMPDFGWLVIGNVGKIIGITLTSTLTPPQETQTSSKARTNDEQTKDLMIFNEQPCNNSGGENNHLNNLCNSNPPRPVQCEFEQIRPDKRSVRGNYNLRGHLDEVILVKWNELYQKLATIDSKGNVLIWCKINQKFTIQTPFYNRTKSVADFKWSNDGKTALICYTDSFILVGSSSGQRHWHSMLNLDDYHITCASWTPNDEQLLLGVSNGNVVIIDLPRSELTEVTVNQTHIRTMCWSSYEMNLTSISKQSNPRWSRKSSTSSSRRNSTVVNHRRLSRDCSVFSRYRFCSQGPSNPRSSGGSMTRSPNVKEDKSNEKLFLPHSGSYYDEQRNILAIDFANNTIKLYDGGIDDPETRTIRVNLESYIMQWSSNGKVLAVAGFNLHTTAPSVGCLRCRYLNTIKFYNQRGQLIYEYALRYTRYPITALTWAHNDQRLFLATGPRLHCAKVFFGIPPLSLLAASCFQRHTKLPDKSDILKSILQNYLLVNLSNWRSHNCPIDLHKETKEALNNVLGPKISPPVTLLDSSQTKTISSCESSPERLNVCNNSLVYQYQLPFKLQSKIDQLFAQTIRQPYDEHWSLNDIIWHVPKNEQRYYCTLVCYTCERDINSSGGQYRTDLKDRGSDNHSSDQNKIFVLYVEFQGSLIPILRARRVGFLKPEFVIFDPEDTQLQPNRHRKVSDISQRSSFINNYVQRKIDTQNLQAAAAQQQPIDPTYSMQAPSPFYYTDGFSDNCSDLHLYSAEPRASNSSLGRQSMSDAEHYYNFECDTTNRLNQDKMADLAMNGRSHHQEPIAVPMSSNPYLLYMMAMSASNHQQVLRNPPGIIGNDFSPMLQGCALNKRPPITGVNKLRGSGLGSTLRETNEIVRIKSNIWGTKFKLINVDNRMIKQRSLLGSVVYKASILHLQPRQIFLTIKDMSNYCVICSKHHHTRLSSSSSRKHNRTSDATAIGYNNPAMDPKISLLDIPNAPLAKITTPLKSSGSGSKRATPKKSLRKQVDEDKVIISVGDGIRVAPKLEKNQMYKSANSFAINDSQKPSTSRGDTGWIGQFQTQKSSDSCSWSKRLGNSISSRSQNGNSPSKMSARTSNKLSRYYQDALRSFESSSSETHASSSFRADETSQSSTSSYHEVSSHNSKLNSLPLNTSSEEQQDDILTLSLGHGDQVRVEMSSLAKDHPNEECNQDEPKEASFDEFLASNKTLKSIQTITKMIIDLSSKANDEAKAGDDDVTDSEMSSPSKLAKLSDQTRVPTAHKQSTSSASTNYIPPDTPVHRPRRVTSRLANNDAQLLQTQSAHSTPLKFLSSTRADSAQASRRHRHKRSVTKSTSKSNASDTNFPPLPPPPAPVPISRRLSSSAKRLIDGSIRSLYAASGYSSAASDLETEDCEPLVSGGGGSSLGYRPPKESRRRLISGTSGQSQPCTPMKSLSVKQSTDLSSLRAHLFNKLSRAGAYKNGGGEKGGTTSKTKSCSASASQLDTFGDSSHDGSSLFLAPRRCGKGESSYLDSSSSPSSGGSITDDDSDSESYGSSSPNSGEAPQLSRQTNADSKQANVLKKNNKLNYYSSLELRDFDPLEVEGRSGRRKRHEQRQQQQKRCRHSRPKATRRRRRRKSICLNSDCCCAKEFKLNNRPPVWNELSQIYQLDFGGRVTQESAKNLQIDFEGNLALQFGRIDRCTYTLDYKYPFNAVQAMAIALASLTQRLK